MTALRFRKLTKMQAINDGTRSLIESIMMPELIAALRDWAKSSSGGALIGGLGLSYHVRPRFTQDVDFLFLKTGDFPEVIPGFDRLTSDTFEHLRTRVQVNIVTPSARGIPKEIAEEIVRTATLSNRIRVASPSGLVASKLFRLSAQDKADIIALIKTGRVDLSEFRLPPERLMAFDELVSEAATDPHPP
jgi:hypothetical protein